MSKNLVGVLIKSALGLVGVLVLMFVAGVVAGYLEAAGVITEGHAFLWVMSVFAVALMVGAFWVGLAWMRSIDEAARILGCAPGTVNSRCSRGRARLAVLLQHLKEVN